uniref:Uncharacterized protein n=1 Tax=Rhipicephalus microplus TaxID=6941 RepID=A0A6G5AGL4_RHIMP
MLLYAYFLYTYLSKPYKKFFKTLAFVQYIICISGRIEELLKLNITISSCSIIHCFLFSSLILIIFVNCRSEKAQFPLLFLSPSAPFALYKRETEIQ